MTYRAPVGDMLHAMHHGGPYPATSSTSTSVGGTAIERGVRPVAVPGAPQGPAAGAEVPTGKAVIRLCRRAGHLIALLGTWTPIPRNAASTPMMLQISSPMS